MKPSKPATPMRFLTPAIVLLLTFGLLLPGCASNESKSGGGGSGYDSSYTPSSPDLSFVDKDRGDGYVTFYSSESAMAPSMGEETGRTGETASGSTAVNPEEAAAGRKVIFSYDFQIETTEMDETLLALETAVRDNKGYIENSTYTGRSNSNQFAKAQLVCRIPVSAAGSFKEAVEASGHVIAKNEKGIDVSDEYFDTEARLKTLRMQEERLLELLGKADNLSDIMGLERELNRVQTDIERLTGTLRKLDNLVELATFTITVYNVSELTEYVTYEEKTFGTRLRESAKDSWNNAVSLVQALIIAIVYILPYALFLGIVLAAILVPIQASSRRKKKAALAAFGPPVTQPLGVPGSNAPDSSSAPMPDPPSSEGDKDRD